MNIKLLKESAIFLNLLFDNVTSAVYLVDKSVTVRNFNDSFRTLFQKSDDKLLGQLCGNALGCSFAVEESKDCGSTTNCDKCTLRNSILKAVTQNVPTYKEILIKDFYIKGEKITKYFQFSTKELVYNSETMIMVIIDDISALKVTEIQLQEKNEKLNLFNKQLNNMMSVVAHDLRNPIGAIRAFADHLKYACNEFSEEEREEIFDIIHESSSNCLLMLDDMLDYSRFEAGKIEFSFDFCDYTEILKQNIKQNSVLAKKKKIKIEKTLTDKIPLLKIDSNRIKQVLDNLISNAIKYSPENTIIKIIVSIDNGNLKTEVTDEGSGIPASEINELFRPFKRTSVKTTAGESSTGLGLAIVRKIVEQHNGKVGVGSEIGKGSNFYFLLPLISENE